MCDFPLGEPQIGWVEIRKRYVCCPARVCVLGRVDEALFISAMSAVRRLIMRVAGIHHVQPHSKSTEGQLGRAKRQRISTCSGRTPSGDVSVCRARYAPGSACHRAETSLYHASSICRLEG